MVHRTVVLSSPIGPIALDSDESAVTAVRLRVSESPSEVSDPLLREAAREIDEYFAGARRSFSIPVRRPETATAFQHALWDALERIPFGETRTYGEIARELGTSARAVGGACARNALPLLIPCHRVVAKTGLGGFSGDWETGMAVDVKKVLLAHERGARGSTCPPECC